jgi:hypothetical protein
VLLAPVRLLGRRIGDGILALAALGGIAVSAGSFAALIVSEYRPLFGFRESGYRLAIELTLVFEGLSIFLLAGFLLALALRRTGLPRPATRVSAMPDPTSVSAQT